MKLKDKLVKIIFITLFCFLLSGCQAGLSDTEGGEVKLLVTTGYGKEIIFDDTVEALPGQSVLVLMDRHLDVDYAYGGRFVNSIEGISSGFTGVAGGSEKKDWFFYLNGISSGTGAADYYPQQGDVIWWDYNSWDAALIVPAVTGAFPQPFVNGYREENPCTIIMYGKENKPQAAEIENYLKERGAEGIELMPYREEKASSRGCMTMVIAPWRELKNSSFWQGLQDHRKQSGWFVEIDSHENIIPLDEAGEKDENSLKAEGVVIATGSDMGDRHPLWFITAVNKQKKEKLISLITDYPELIYGRMGAVMVNDEILPLPVTGDKR